VRGGQPTLWGQQKWVSFFLARPIVLIIAMAFGGLLAFAQSEAFASPRSDAMTLRVHEGRISVEAAQVPLHHLLDVLAQHASLMVTVNGTVGQRSVSVSFSDLPLAEGLDRILVGTDYAVVGARSSKEGALMPGAKKLEVVVLGPRGGVAPAELDPVSSPQALPSRARPQAPRKEPRFQQHRHSLTTQDRLAALDELMWSSEESQHLPILKTALRDENLQVRARALEVLEGIEGNPPMSALVNVALKDQDPHLRMKALEMLVDRDVPAARVVLRRAGHDLDPSVRELAASLMQALEQ